MIPTIAVTLGDYNGIGPEVVLKVIQRLDLEQSTPVLIGQKYVVDFYKESTDDDFSNSIPYCHEIEDVEDAKKGVLNIINVVDEQDIEILPGTITKAAGYMAMKAVQKAVDLAKANKVQAMVTAPISKEAVNLAGWEIPGHTEFLAHQTACNEYMMMLVNDGLRVGLVSIHDPLRDVAAIVGYEQILRKINIMHSSLQSDFSIDNPKVAVLGMNPHAGDGGYIGQEEIDIITPAIEEARSANIFVDGPFAADGFFGNRHYKQYDGVLAMYHDQGLIPFKTLSFYAGVNFTAGLPIIRTSPDHGTAFDIAGKQQASHNSMLKAYRLAVSLSQKRYN